MNALQNENDELNAVKDFNLDAWIDEIEPPQQYVTVNTRGDLLAKYLQVREAIDEELRALSALEQSLPDEEDPAEVVGSGVHAVQLEQFEAAKGRIALLVEKRDKISADYAANKATFTFATLDPEERARATQAHQDHLGKAGIVSAPEQVVRLLLASIDETTITHNGVEKVVNSGEWTVKTMQRFLAKIGEGQAAKLWQAYLGLGMADVTPPFSPASSSGGTGSTF